MTPFVAISLRHCWVCVATNVAQWVIAALGVSFQVYAMHHKMKNKMPIEVALSVTQAFTILFMKDDVMAIVTDDILNLLIVSGASYLIGLVFFLFENNVHPIVRSFSLYTLEFDSRRVVSRLLALVCQRRGVFPLFCRAALCHGLELVLFNLYILILSFGFIVY